MNDAFRNLPLCGQNPPAKQAGFCVVRSALEQLIDEDPRFVSSIVCESGRGDPDRGGLGASRPPRRECLQDRHGLIRSPHGREIVRQFQLGRVVPLCQRPQVRLGKLRPPRGNVVRGETSIGLSVLRIDCQRLLQFLFCFSLTVVPGIESCQCETRIH